MADEQRKAIIDALPAPQTAEEQYLYSFACTLAGVEYQIPFQTPFYRKEKLLKAIWQLEQMKAVTPISGPMIENGAISKEKLDEETGNAVFGDGRIDTAAIKDGAVTEEKLSAGVGGMLLKRDSVKLVHLTKEVSDKLIGHKNIVEDNLDASVSDKLLQIGNVVEKNLSPEVSKLLLHSGNVTLDHLSQEVVNKMATKEYADNTAKETFEKLDGDEARYATDEDIDALFAE